MSNNLQALDEFPTFTGEESPQEQIRQLQNYLFIVKEQLQFAMRNIGIDNLNAAQWDMMKTQTLEGQSQEEAFNKLTNNGKAQGLFMIDGQIFINAAYLATGVIASADGTVKVDLGNNCVTIDGMRNGYKTQIKLSASGMQGYGANREGKMEHVMSILLGVGGTPSGIWNDAWEENTGLSFGTVSGELSIGTSEASTKIYGDTISLVSAILGDVVKVGLNGLEIFGKGVSWKANGDGTYTMIGQ